MKLNRLVLICAFFSLFGPINSQDYDEKFPSKEETEFYEQINSNYSVPYSLDYISKLNFDYILAIEDTLRSNPLRELRLENSDWSKSEIHFEEDSANKNNERLYDFSKCRFVNYFRLGIDSVGPFATYSIIHYDSIENIKCILFKDSKYDYDSDGYWVAIQLKGIWHKYYLGLTEDYFYHFKTCQNYPLFFNDSIIQVEAALVRQKTPECLPVGPPETFEIIRDHILLRINLKKVILDSDHDGLTDIEEQKMLLNPYSNDTDKDGIPDNLDNNPRFKSEISEISKLYCYIISNDDYLRDTCVDVSNWIEAKIHTQYSNEPFMIVTDDSNFKNLSFGKKVIVLTTEENKKYKYPIGLNPLGVSQLFKVDNRANYYKFHTSYKNSGDIYIVNKIRKDTWRIKLISSWII